MQMEKYKVNIKAPGYNKVELVFDSISDAAEFVEKSINHVVGDSEFVITRIFEEGEE